MRYITTDHHETAQHKKTSNAARSRWRKENPAATRYDNVPTKFVCIDGEGITLDDGRHLYVLLGVDDQQIENPDGLPWDQVLDFLWEQFLKHGTKSVAYTGFFLGYDFCQMFLKQLPEERARMLLTAEGRVKRAPKSPDRIQPFPVEYQGWEFDILGNKRLKLRKKGADRWMHICDTGSFFQKSLLKVLDPKEWSDPVVSENIYETIKRGKDRRSIATLDDDMRLYNILENQALSQVLERLNEGFQSLGIHLKPNQWFGPGQAAQEWLKGRAISSERLQEITPKDVLEAARMSYFGGWFEIPVHGIVPDISWEYDINSAYPWVISRLPCLEHGTWKHNSVYTNYTLVYASVKGSDPYIGAMLHRDKDGNIYRPHKTEGWYWYHEIQAAKQAGLIDNVVIGNSWSYHPCDCPPPFAEVSEIYKLRQQVGKKTPLGMACKYVPNSLYGKFAQSIGNPQFGNPAYASLITAGCRTRILDAIASHPDGTKDMLMVATDGVYFRTANPGLTVSGELGGWDTGTKQNLCLFKPGVYWDDNARQQIRNGQVPVFKTRGINARDFASQIQHIDWLFRENVLEENNWPAVRFPVQFSMVTPLQALQRNKWHLAGTLITGEDSEVVQSSEPYSKRTDVYRDGDLWRSKPRVNEPYEASHAYEKRFGLDDPFSQETGETYGETPNGLPGMLFREGLSL